MAPTLHDARLVAATYEVNAEILRLYESRGLLRPVLIGGVRYYTPRDRVRLEIILKGKRFGFSLAEIEKLVLGATRRPSDSRVSQKQNVERIIEELRTLTGRRDDLDASIDALKARLDEK